MRYKPVLLLIGATLCALSAAARPPLPSLEQRRLAHIEVDVQALLALRPQLDRAGP